MRAFFPLTLIALLCALAPASASEWPKNWLGNPDPAYRVLNIGVYYHAAVLRDMPDADGNESLPGDPQEWLEILAARPELSRPAMEAEFERVKGELEENRRFYWCNTRFNLLLDFDYITDWQPRLHSELGKAEAPWHSPVDWEYYGDVRERYDGLMQIKVFYVYDDETGDLKRISAGGWTHGASDDGTKCGWSWWLAPEADKSAGSDWLMCHEFGHQLDSLFARSGHPEHWFNHLSLLEGNVERFGEHYDCMSYILRRIREADWHDLKWGETRVYNDADGDKMPDPDSYLLEFNVELDPDPTRADSDGDMLSDYWEVLANNGNRVGHGERLHPALRFTHPLHPDSDGDGLLDGEDPLPWLPLSARIPTHGIPHWSDLEEPEPLAAPATMSLSAPNGSHAFRLALSAERDTALEITVDWGSVGDEREYDLQFMFDFNNNGWFAGDDNYRLQFDADGVTLLRQGLGASSTEWHRETDEGMEADWATFEPATPAAGYTHTARLTIPHEHFPALAAKPGEEFGLSFGLRAKGSPWFYTINEPNAQIPLELQ